MTEKITDLYININSNEQLFIQITWPQFIKLFSCSTQLSTKFQLLIKTKILTNKDVSCFKPLRCGIYHANKR